MLWLALHLPRLPLEVFPACTPPSVVISRERIVFADEAAAEGGVQPGMRLAEAWALLPRLAVQERNTAFEEALLQQLACWAGNFTSEVCVLPQGLLLEIGCSLRLFGGVAPLCAAIVAGCREQGFCPTVGIAPTPRAACWLALAGDSDPCIEAASLRPRLLPLPLDILGLQGREAAGLAGIGARTVGDLLALPRAGLSRRLGVAFVRMLAQALGEVPDLRERFIFPERFEGRLELPGRVDNALALAFACRRLLNTLGGWLLARAAGIAECTFAFEHAGGLRARPPTLLKLGFAGATSDVERMGRVLLERLQRLSLEAPVEALCLSAASAVPLGGREQSLFPASGPAGGEGLESVSSLVEHLQARLGGERVHSLRSVAEYRPENASLAVIPLSGKGNSGGFPSSSWPDQPGTGGRPLWLLRRAEALAEFDGRPVRAGPLELLAGPERIENGWWDGEEPGGLGDVRRDYFVALSRQGEWLWIFRSEAGWFVHGFFA